MCYYGTHGNYVINIYSHWMHYHLQHMCVCVCVCVCVIKCKLYLTKVVIHYDHHISLTLGPGNQKIHHHSCRKDIYKTK
jgi:hypothetical protein